MNAALDQILTPLERARGIVFDVHESGEVPAEMLPVLQRAHGLLGTVLGDMRHRHLVAALIHVEAAVAELMSLGAPLPVGLAGELGRAREMLREAERELDAPTEEGAG